MERYDEKFVQSKQIRDDQYNQMSDYIARITGDGASNSEGALHPDFSSLDNYVESIEEFREIVENAIGYPPPHGATDRPVREEYAAEDDLCTIYRLYIPVDADLDCYGLYLVPKSRPATEKTPLMLSFHGGGGCPELICNFERTDNYNDASRRFLRKGFIVFAPLFTFRSQADGENTDIPVNTRHMLDMQAKWAGTSLAAIEVYKVVKALDYLLTKKEIDADRVAVSGLSYGGFYALMVSALEKRIRFCISSCYFNDRILVNRTHPSLFSDWTWKGSVKLFSDAGLVALICPRPCFIEVGVKDELFSVEGARATVDKARIWYEKLGIADRFHYDEFDGTHEFNLAFFDGNGINKSAADYFNG